MKLNILCCRVDFQSYGFTTNLKIPKLKIEGNYTLKGRILLLPLQGRGKAVLEPGENLYVKRAKCIIFCTDCE